MSPTPRGCPHPLRAELAELLPPHAVGLPALDALAARLKQVLAARPQPATLTSELLASSLMSAWDVLVRRARREARLNQEQAEEVVAGLASRLSSLFATWRGEGTLSAYLIVILGRDARALQERERRVEAAVEVEEAASPEAELLGGLSREMQSQALLRFAWFLYGSPDNPARLQYDRALADFLALSAQLAGRSYDELVLLYQPRPGSWGLGAGEADRKWWRGRACLARRRLFEALEEPANQRVFERIVAEINAGRSPEAASHPPRAHSAGPKKAKTAPTLSLKPGAPTRISGAPSALAS